MVPHALDGALLGLDHFGGDGAQPLDEAADLVRVRVEVKVDVRVRVRVLACEGEGEGED